MTDRPALDDWLARSGTVADQADALQARVLNMVTRPGYEVTDQTCWADSPHHPEPDGYHILGEATATHTNGLCDYHHAVIVTGEPYEQPPKPAPAGRVERGVLIKPTATNLRAAA